jgi:hypothetical protein
MAKKQANPVAMIDLIAEAIAGADGGDLATGRVRYRRLALAALALLLKPTTEMIDAAPQVVWSDGFWAINSRRDFEKAVRAMIAMAMKPGKARGLDLFHGEWNYTLHPSSLPDKHVAPSVEAVNSG